MGFGAVGVLISASIRTSRIRFGGLVGAVLEDVMVRDRLRLVVEEEEEEDSSVGTSTTSLFAQRVHENVSPTCVLPKEAGRVKMGASRNGSELLELAFKLETWLDEERELGGPGA